MKYAFAAIAAAQLAAAHTTFQSFVIDGTDQGQHFAVQTPSNGNNPIKDVTSTSMICNGGTATSDRVKVTAGSKVAMQWHHSDPGVTSGDADEPIAASHKGPVMVYIAPLASNGEGDVWVKIYEDGLTDGTWGVTNFITNKGLITVTLPDLADGDYLIRPEMIGLHEASTQGAAQFYNGCGQITVSGGSTELPTGVDMTKAYSATDPGVLYNIYAGLTTYTIPGPSVWDGTSSGSTASKAASTAAASTKAASTSAAASTKAAASATAISVAKEEVASTSAAATSAKATSAAATSSAVATSSAAATSAAATSAKATPSASASASASTGSSSTLPETFTMTEFIAWLRVTVGSTASKARRHARQFA